MEGAALMATAELARVRQANGSGVKVEAGPDES